MIDSRESASRMEMAHEARLAYWLKPYGVRIETSHFSGTFKFDTAEEAIKYIFDQFKRVQQIIDNREYGNSWVNFDCHRSWFDDHGQKVQAQYVLNVCALSSNYGLEV